jgi:hypothetical protein
MKNSNKLLSSIEEKIISRIPRVSIFSSYSNSMYERIYSRLKEKYYDNDDEKFNEAITDFIQSISFWNKNLNNYFEEGNLRLIKLFISEQLKKINIPDVSENDLNEILNCTDIFNLKLVYKDYDSAEQWPIPTVEFNDLKYIEIINKLCSEYNIKFFDNYSLKLDFESTYKDSLNELQKNMDVIESCMLIRNEIKKKLEEITRKIEIKFKY